MANKVDVGGKITKYAYTLNAGFDSPSGYNYFYKDNLNRTGVALHGRRFNELAKGTHIVATIPLGFRPSSRITDVAVIYTSMGNPQASIVALDPNGDLSLMNYTNMTGEIYFTATLYYDGVK